MSLIITSNIEDEVGVDETSNIFQPFSYSNRLLDTMRIPPNSQIALQSAKITKKQQLVIGRNNNIFGNYFGLPLDGTGSNIDESTSVPFVGTLGSKLRRGTRSIADGETKTVTVGDTAAFIQEGLEERCYHPSLITDAVKGTGTDDVPEIPVGANVTVTPKYTANVWDGFQWVFTQQTAITKKTANFNFVDVSQEKTGIFSLVGTNAVKQSADGAGFQVQARNQPISQNDGECIMDWSLANSTANRSSFFCGLTRINSEKENGITAPDNFDANRGGGTGSNGGGFRNCGGQAFCDICIMRIGSFLRVFQSGTSGESQQLIMNEIIYYGAHNANFPNIYNLQTNAANDKYEKVKFKLTNEHISIFLIDDAGSEVLLTDNIVSTSKGALKNEVTNPTTCAKWAMYPHFGARGVDKQITIDYIQHYTSYPDFALPLSEKPEVYDWWIFSESGQNGGTTRWATAMEARPWNDAAEDVVLTPKLLTGADAMDGYENQIITAPLKGDVSFDGPSRRALFLNTKPCNTGPSFGMVNHPVSAKEAGINTLIITILSAQTPSSGSNVSLFVRLNNFTQLSTNARMGTRSKIVGHLPRFDNSGAESGALYFEPNEKTYIDLNNPNELVLNSFDVDLCYDNERLAAGLSGKTVIIFHIRDKPK